MQANVGRGHITYGVIATGNHVHCDSLRDAPPRRSGNEFYAVKNDREFNISGSNDTAHCNRCVGGVMTPPYNDVWNSQAKQNLHLYSERSGQYAH